MFLSIADKRVAVSWLGLPSTPVEQMTVRVLCAVIRVSRRWSFIIPHLVSFTLQNPNKRTKLSHSYKIPSWEINPQFEALIAQLEQENKRSRWVGVGGSPSQETAFLQAHIEKVLENTEPALLSSLGFRDPKCFVAGELHRHVEIWEHILADHHDRHNILRWIREGVEINEFTTRFQGCIKGKQYNSLFPPPTVLQNLNNCKQFTEFISNTIVNRIRTGAVKVWGQVDVSEPPYLVLPLTVEPAKPRLCLDARFVNCWMKDSPFSLDKLNDIKTYVYKGSHMTKCDDKSGYDHVSLTKGSQAYFGFEWAGWWFVSTTLPFGWKESAFIYQTLGSAVSSFLRNLGIPCSLYIDDRLVGEIMTPVGPWSLAVDKRPKDFSLKAAQTAIYLTCYIVIALGYSLGFSKCVLKPTTQLEYLGFIVDSELQTFKIPEQKIQKFLELREAILRESKSVGLKSLQKLQGKCVSFSLAVPAAKLYIRNMCGAIASSHGKSHVNMSKPLRDEIAHWRFIDSWTGHIPWREEKHTLVTVSSDASGSGWGGLIHFPGKDVPIRDYWSQEEMEFNISTKETLAVARLLQSATDIQNCRIDVQTDSQVLIHTWAREGSRSQELSDAIKELFVTVSQKNIQLHLQYVTSKSNEADEPSRALTKSDTMLSQQAWSRIQERFGGRSGHSIDLMALDSNAQRGQSGEVLPHFTPFPAPKSTGVNMFAQSIGTPSMLWHNPYIFPPFNLISPVLRFLLPSQIAFTLVVPVSTPKPVWWPLLKSVACDSVLLGYKNDWVTLLAPSKKGFAAVPCPVDIWAFRVLQHNP